MRKITLLRIISFMLSAVMLTTIPGMTEWQKAWATEEIHNALDELAFLGDPPVAKEPEFIRPSRAVISVRHDLTKEEIVAVSKEYPHTGFDGSKVTAYATQPSCTAPYEAGSLDPADIADALNALKMVRFLGGVPYENQTFPDESNNIAQHGAVLLAAINQLTHYPDQPADMSKEFFDIAYRGCREANLYSGSTNISTAVISFMTDGGTNNIQKAGHRRWMLRPNGADFGIGYAQAQYAPRTSVYVFGGYSMFADESDSYVAWPNGGDFPIQYFTGSPNLNFQPPYPWSINLGSPYRAPEKDNITLTLTRQRDNKVWVFDKNTPELGTDEGGTGDMPPDSMHLATDNGGYGIMKAIVFRPDMTTLGALQDGDVFTVLLEGIKTTLGQDTTLSYTINFFDLDKAMDPNGQIHAKPPAIYQPSDKTVPVGSLTYFYVSANSPDGGMLTYQWFNEDGTPASGVSENGSFSPPYNTFFTAGTYKYYAVATNTIPDNGDGGNKSASVTSGIVTLTVVPTVPAELSSISITTPPAKTLYNLGETLNLAGMVVTAIYTDNSRQTVTNYTTDPAANALLSSPGEQTVTVSYTEGDVTSTVSFQITVIEKPDKSELESLLSTAYAVNRSNYTSASVRALTAAIALGESVMNNEDASKSDVAGAIEALNAALAGLVTPDKSVLEALMATAFDLLNDLDEGRFNNTVKSDRVLSDAWYLGYTVLYDNNATESDIAEAIEALTAAIEGLVPFTETPENSELLRLMRAARVMLREMNAPTFSSRLFWQAADSFGYLALCYEETAESLIPVAVSYLNRAISGLEEQEPDRYELDRLLSVARGINESDYTAESVRDLREILNLVESVYDYYGYQDDGAVSTMIYFLDIGLAYLTPVNLTFDKAGLEHLLSTAYAVNQDDYTPKSVQSLLAAVEFGEMVLQYDEDEWYISWAVEYLNSAINNLKEKPIKVRLEELLSAAYAVNRSVYTPSSVQALINAIEWGESVMADEDATRRDVTEAIDALNSALSRLIERPDKSGLEAALLTAKAINQSGYCGVTVQALNAAIARGESVMANDDASERDVTGAINAINAAIAGLAAKPDKSGLAAVLATAKAINQSDYTPSSVQPLIAAIALGEAVMANCDATESDITGAINAISATVSGIVARPDKSELGSIYSSANSVNQSAYSAASVQALNAAIAHAESVMSNEDATESDVLAAIAAINAAIAGLVAKPDKSGLASLLSTAKAIHQSDYTAVSVQPLIVAISLGESVMSDEEAVESDVTGAIDAINAAIAGLVAKPDKSGLATILTTAKAINQIDYTPVSVQHLIAAIAFGEAVMSDEEAVESDVTAAIDALNAALEGLVAKERPDKSELESLLSTAYAVNQSNYTTASVQALNAAIALGESVMSNEEAVESDVTAAINAINAAIAGLVQKPDKSGLEAVLSVAYAVNQNNYTDASVQALNAAIALGESVMNDDDATVSDITGAIDALNAALDGLVAKEKPDKSELESLLSTAYAVNQSNYTTASVQTLIEAIALGESVMNDDDATENDITGAINALNSALDGLTAVTLTCSAKSMLAKVAKLQAIPYEWNDTPDTLVFTTSNPAVCGVTPDGTLIPMKAGIAVITIAAPNGAKIIFAVTVSA